MKLFTLTNHDCNEPGDADLLIGVYKTLDAAKAGAMREWNALMEDEAETLEWNPAGTGRHDAWPDDEFCYVITECDITE